MANLELRDATHYTFSAAGSRIGFVGAKVTGKHTGTFTSFEGAIDVAGNDPTKSKVHANIDVASLQADDPKLTNHLKSPDLLDAAKFSRARFVSTSVAPGAKAGEQLITGNFELHGVTKSITFPAAVRLGADQVDVSAEFVINRKDFGIVYPGMPDDLIADDVLIALKLAAKRSAPSVL